MSRISLRGAAVVAIAVLALVLLTRQGRLTDIMRPAAQSATSLAAFAPAGIPIRYGFDSQAVFYATPAGNLFFCTKGGIKYITAAGAEKWNYAFNMALPIMAGSGDDVAVAEANGNYLYVFNQDGLLYSKKFELPILSFSVNGGGFSSAILKDVSGFRVEVDGQGFSPYQRQLQDQNIIPVTSSVSNDGRILGINFLNTNLTGAKYSSYLAFTYVNKSDSDASGKDFFASKIVNDHIIADIRFMDGNQILTFSDSQAEAMQVGANNFFRELKTIDLTNRVDYLAFLPGGGFAAALGARLSDGVGDDPGSVVFFNANLDPTGSFELGRAATYLSAARDKAIAGSGRDYYALDSRGRLLWRYSSTQDLKQVLFLNNSDTVLFVSNTEADIMKRKR